MYRVLVLCRSLDQADEFQKQIASAKYPDVQFIYPPSLSTTSLDYLALFNDCKELITNDYVDVIMCFKPGLELVQAALVQEFPELRGPSVEGAFLCVHRAYNKKWVCTGFNLEYGIISPEDATQTEVASILDETGTPVFIRDIYRAEGAMTCRRARSVRGVLKDKDEIHECLVKSHDLIDALLLGRIHGPKYTHLDEKTCLLEEYWDPGAAENVSVHHVEGCVVNEEFTPWVISDVFYQEDKPRCVKGVMVPSGLNESAQFHVWATLREAVQRLIQSGFNNQFLEATVSLAENGTVKILDMGASLNLTYIPLYRHVFQNGDTLNGLVNIGLGRVARHPKLLPLRYAIMGCVTSFTPGFALDMLNMKIAKSNKDVHVLVEEHAELKSRDPEGSHVANVYALCTSYDECVDKVTSIVKDIVKPGIKCTWIDT